jgi:hypothetical protein
MNTYQLSLMIPPMESHFLTWFDGFHWCLTSQRSFVTLKLIKKGDGQYIIQCNSESIVASIKTYLSNYGIDVERTNL